jgi:predicted nucleic acid-binding protein
VKNSWVVNASSLILLAKVGRIHLLLDLSETLVIPASVAVEIEAGPASDPAVLWLRSKGGHWVQADLPVEPAIAAWDLGNGETAALNWACQRPGFEAILDDRAARKCALIQRLPYRGTLGVILAAKKQGLIPAAKPLCDQVVKAGLLIDQTLLQSALGLVGE